MIWHPKALLHVLMITLICMLRTGSGGIYYLHSLFSQCYVIRGMWKSELSKSSGLLGGDGSLSALWRSLKSPVPIFIGIPIMIHSDTPETQIQETVEVRLFEEPSRILHHREAAYHTQNPSVQSRRRQKDDRLFSRRMPAWGRSPSSWPSQTWWSPGSPPFYGAEHRQV